MAMLKMCYLCGHMTETHRHHMLHGSMRDLAEEDGLTCNLCPKCHALLHDTGKNDRALQIEAEKRWIEQDPNRTVEDFIRRYGKNYL